jgi:hypothetical protein
MTPSGSFVCDRLEFIVPDQDFHFQRVDTFFLGTGGRKREKPQQSAAGDTACPRA